MADDNPAPQADEAVVDNKEEAAVSPEQALVESMVDVDGELVDNPTVDFNQGGNDADDEGSADGEQSDKGSSDADDASVSADKGDGEAAEGAGAADGGFDSKDGKSTAELVEKDETGVFAPVTATNPGEFTPSDYSFEVMTTDGKTVKIDSPEAAQALATQLDEEPGLLNASQYMKLNTQTALMMQQQVADKRAYDQQKEDYDQQQAQVQVRNDTINKWDKEISYLTSKGELPAVPDELNTAEAGAKWASDYADREGVKERLELFKFMETENEKRQAAGLDPMTSMLEAHTELRLQRMTSADKETETKDKTTRRAKGSLVGGPSPYIPSNTKAGEIVGTPGSINDVMLEYMNQ